MRDPRRARWGAALAAGTLTLALAAPVGAQDGVQEIGYIAPEPATALARRLPGGGVCSPAGPGSSSHEELQGEICQR